MGERISRLIGIPKIPPGVGESRHFCLSPSSLQPIGSTSHRIFITVPVTNKLLIPCRVLDSHFCRLCLDSFCLALHRSLLPYSIPVPLFISLSPPLSLSLQYTQYIPPKLKPDLVASQLLRLTPQPNPPPSTPHTPTPLSWLLSGCLCCL